MIHTSNAVSANWYRQFEPLAASFGVEPISAPVDSLADVERVIETLGRSRDSGLIVPGDTFVESLPVREVVVKATAAHRLPAIYSRRDYAVNGGLMSYGTEQTEQYRDAAPYVDRILKARRRRSCRCSSRRSSISSSISRPHAGWVSTFRCAISSSPTK
jgi:ABC-type uncharacterized transport system substrate-binding protein